MATTAPYGTWPSPLDPTLLVAGTRGLSELGSDGPDLYWSESRPTEGGRVALRRRDPDGNVEDLTPTDSNARTRVHEYGGGATLVADGIAWFVEFTDQRIRRRDADGRVRVLTPEPDAFAALRYADLALSPDGAWLFCVRERHLGQRADEVVNELVALRADGSPEDPPTVLAQGRDFYASPRVSPDGRRLAYVAWDHPDMPWDETELLLADLEVDHGTPRLSATISVAGGRGGGQSVIAPAWSPAGELHAISDVTGWWNLYRWDPDRGQLVHLAPVEKDLAGPQWQLGGPPYAFLDDGRIGVVVTDHAVMRPALLDPATGTITGLDTPHTWCRSLSAAGSDLCFLGGAPRRPDAIVHVEVTTGAWEELFVSSELPVDPAWLPEPEVISFPTGHDMTAHALYHRPTHPELTGPDDELPPLIVTTHGGPTAHVSPRVELGIAYWTSRGYAVVDVNYRGSTGFGRAYRQALYGQWGVYDVEDAIAAAHELVRRGEVDPDRMVIRGGSAGGFTTLAALTFHDVFAAGASHFGVADLAALAEETHKFESHYLDRLVGPYPQMRERYRARSPIHHAERLSCPVILLQGLRDRVVPPSQAEAMTAAMAARGIPYAYVTFEDEDHGFRRAENVVRALEAEQSFYAQVFGFTPADDLEPVEIVRSERP